MSTRAAFPSATYRSTNYWVDIVFAEQIVVSKLAPQQIVSGIAPDIVGTTSASQNVVGGLAQLRLSFYPNVDFGFHGGLTRLDPGGTSASLTTLRLGGDLRWQVAQVAQGSRVDVAVGGALGVETADNLNVLSLGPSVVGSRALNVGGNGGLVPYAGMALNFTRRDAFGIQDSEISVPLRFGAEVRLAPEFRIVAELQVFVADRYNDDIGFATGVNLPF